MSLLTATGCGKDSCPTVATQNVNTLARACTTPCLLHDWPGCGVLEFRNRRL